MAEQVAPLGYQAYDGLLWPANTAKPKKYLGHANRLVLALPFCTQRRSVVQAGGHCGAFPLWLARQFQRVYTFEPEARNFACLVSNVMSRGLEERVFAARGLLGIEHHPLRLGVHGKNSGGHKVTTQARGFTPQYRIDDLGLDDVDLIQLDVEFMELPALQGAVDTIERCRPVLMLEARDFGLVGTWGSRGDLMHHVRFLGYEVRTWLGRDAILTMSSR